MKRLLACSLSLNLIGVSLLLVGYVGPSVKTTFVPSVEVPVIGTHTRIHPLAMVSRLRHTRRSSVRCDGCVRPRR